VLDVSVAVIKLEVFTKIPPPPPPPPTPNPEDAADAEINVGET
jgi:hypothetical protein